MRLKSVRVQNYKCVEDSTEFSIEPVTCLVGKNESGKTALLQALYKLNPDIEKRKAFDLLEEYPRRNYSAYKSQHKENPDNILTTTWELEKADQELIIEKVGENAIVNNTVIFKKGYDNKIYYIGSAEGHEYPNLQVGDEVDPRLSFCVNSKSINSCFF